MANYRISPNAKDDLERLWFYGLEHWGLAAADDYYAAFFEHFKQLAAEPFLYPAVDEMREGYRRSICGKDSVFYRINDDVIEIMAVLGQQDIAKWL
jgi:toxin ParE1/3/4